jgi:hypothetical protein
MLFTPPLTPQTPAECQYPSSTSDTTTRPIRYARRSPRTRARIQLDGDVSPELVLPPPLEPVPLVLPEPSLSYASVNNEYPFAKRVEEEWTYSRDMTPEERDKREEWLSEGRGRRGLRIVIVTGTSYVHYQWRPKTDYQKTSYHVSTVSRAPLRDFLNISKKRDISVCSLVPIRVCLHTAVIPW